jgi:hypothetical protein
LSLRVGRSNVCAARLKAVVQVFSALSEPSGFLLDNYVVITGEGHIALGPLSESPQQTRCMANPPKPPKRQYRETSVLLHELEDSLYVLKMAVGPRTRGRRPQGYKGVYSEADVIRMIRKRVLHRV